MGKIWFNSVRLVFQCADDRPGWYATQYCNGGLAVRVEAEQRGSFLESLPWYVHSIVAIQ